MVETVLHLLYKTGVACSIMQLSFFPVELR